MIARIWHGVAPESKAADHINYIRQELLRTYREGPGKRGALLLSRTRNSYTEFLVLSFWESASGLQTLTGADLDKATAWELLTILPQVKNYEVVVPAFADGFLKESG